MSFEKVFNSKTLDIENKLNSNHGLYNSQSNIKGVRFELSNKENELRKGATKRYNKDIVIEDGTPYNINMCELPSKSRNWENIK